MGTPQTDSSNCGDLVKLPPVLGIRPGVYLAVLYAFVLALVLFFALVYPGLVRPGSLVMLKTEPLGAALRVDGVYMGTETDRIFVSKGRHILELALPGFHTERIECDIPGRIFASTLFPRRWPLEVTLQTEDPAAAFAQAAADYSAWTFGGEPTAAWQVPLSLSEGAYRIGPGALQSTPGGLSVEEIIKTAARFAVTRAALRDLLRAGTIADNGGLSPSPLTLARSARAFARFLSENSGSAAWLAETLPPESAALISASQWYQNQTASAANMTASQSIGSGGAPPLERVDLGSTSFTGLRGGVLVPTDPFPYQIPINDFFIASAQVSAGGFAEFSAANPQWGKDQLEILEQQKLAIPGYLDDLGYTQGIASVSWFAANAFCEWLSGRLPPVLAGWEVRLPNEAEWEYAAKAGMIKLDKTWEWCADPFSPLPFLNAPMRGIIAVGSPERPVRGGLGWKPEHPFLRNCAPLLSPSAR